MISITQIDENLTIFKENKLILWGIDETIFLMFKSFEIDTVYFCDDKRKDEGTFSRVPIITEDELAEIIENDCNSDNKGIIVQISRNVRNISEVINKLENMGITNYIYPEESMQILSCVRKAEGMELNGEMEKTTDTGTIVLDTYKQIFYKNINQDENNEALLVCMPRKTGDFTINNTLNEHRIKFFNMWHTPCVYDKNVFDSKYECIKIISAVRDPISQIISNLYEEISHIEMSFMRVIDGKLFDNGFTDIDDVIKNGGDVQRIFDKRNDIVFEKYGKYTAMNDFYSKFNENIIDITSSSFDTEKGFSIVKNGNMEVFIYQLERINDIIRPLSDFVGNQFDEYIKGNIAADKWVAQSYEKAQKELEFSKEFFNSCYDEPYVKHFYTNEQISDFKSKWEKNVIK